MPRPGTHASRSVPRGTRLSPATNRLSPGNEPSLALDSNAVNFMSRKFVVRMGLGAHELSGSLGVASRTGRLRRAARGLARGGMRCL